MNPNNILKKIEQANIRKLQSSNRRMPSLLNQAKSAARSVVKNTQTIIKGNSPKISDAEQKRRLDICNKCEFLQNNRCTKCGCFLSIKTYLRAEQCPVGKW